MSDVAAAPGATAGTSAGEGSQGAIQAVTATESTNQVADNQNTNPDNTTDKAPKTATKTAKETVEPATEITEEAPKPDKPTKKQLREWAKENLEQDFDDDDKADDFVREFATNSHKLNKQLMTAFDSQPELGAITSMVVKDGIPWVEAMGELMTPDEYRDMLNDTEGGRKALAKRIANIEQQKAEAKEVEANKVESDKAYVEFAKKNGITDKQGNELFDKTIIPIFKSLLSMKLDDQTFEMFWKLHNRDKDVQTAAQIAEAKTRLEKNKIEKETIKGDGLPQIQGGGGAAKTKETPEKKLSMVARVAAQNIEERSRL